METGRCGNGGSQLLMLFWASVSSIVKWELL